MEIVEITIKLRIEAPDKTAGQQAAAAFCEPAIRQITGQQVPMLDGGAFDIEAMKALAADAIRKTFTAPFLQQQANLLEAEKQQKLAALHEQATAGMALEVSVG